MKSNTIVTFLFCLSPLSGCQGRKGQEETLASSFLDQPPPSSELNPNDTTGLQGLLSASFSVHRSPQIQDETSGQNVTTCSPAEPLPARCVRCSLPDALSRALLTRHTHTHTYTHTHSKTLTLTHTQAFTHSYTRALTQSHTYTVHKHSHTHIHKYSQTHAHIHSHKLSHTHSYPPHKHLHIRIHIPKHSHTHTPTHSHTSTHTPSHTLTQFTHTHRHTQSHTFTHTHTHAHAHIFKLKGGARSRPTWGKTLSFFAQAPQLP